MMGARVERGRRDRSGWPCLQERNHLRHTTKLITFAPEELISTLVRP